MTHSVMSESQPAGGTRKDLLQLVALIGGGTLAVRGLLQLGDHAGFAVPWNDLTGWFSSARAEDVLLSTLWIVTLGLAAWVTGTALIYTLARLTRLPSAIRAVEWATLPAVRRMAERALAASLAVSTLVGSGGVAALASEHGHSTGPAPTAVVLDVGDVSPSSQPEHTTLRTPAYVPTLAGDVSGSPADQADPTVDEIAPPGPHRAPASMLGFAGGTIDLGLDDIDASPQLPTTYTVQVGDNLWTIAERHVAAATGRTPAEAEVARYWSTLVDVNRGLIRSGDPDLIFPGEHIECPPVTARIAQFDGSNPPRPWRPL